MNVPKQVKEAPMWMKAVGIIVIATIIAPIGFKLFTGVVSFIAAGLLVLLAFHLGPAIAEWIANLGLEANKAAWKTSPIPTLQRQYAQKVEELGEKRKNLKTFMASVETVRASNEAYAGRFPLNKDKIANLDRVYKNLVRIREVREKKYQAAGKAIENFAVVIEEAELYWKAALAANNAAALEEADNDPMEMLKTKTSLGAVQDQLNLAFSELDVALLEEPKDEHGVIIDITPQIALKEPVR